MSTVFFWIFLDSENIQNLIWKKAENDSFDQIFSHLPQEVVADGPSFVRLPHTFVYLHRGMG